MQALHLSAMAGIKHPGTPEGRYFVVKDKLWRLSDPGLDPRDRARLVKALMDARRAFKDAKKAGDREAELDAKGWALSRF